MFPLQRPYCLQPVSHYPGLALKDLLIAPGLSFLGSLYSQNCTAFHLPSHCPMPCVPPRPDCADFQLIYGSPERGLFGCYTYAPFFANFLNSFPMTFYGWASPPVYGIPPELGHTPQARFVNLNGDSAFLLTPHAHNGFSSSGSFFAFLRFFLLG